MGRLRNGPAVDPAAGKLLPTGAQAGRRLAQDRGGRSQPGCVRRYDRRPALHPRQRLAQL